ncbi:MAG: phosphate ABC transporter permease subunit PstC [Bacteroidales bacterium]|jgi:phosphate transport system permease protein
MNYFENINNDDEELKPKDENTLDYSPQKGFTSESLKKKFRLSEFLAEKLITLIAFLSITIIILIFVFVFRESLPIFYKTKKAKTEKIISTNSKTENVNSNGQETYGVETKKETPTNSNGQEQYGAVTDNNKIKEEERKETPEDRASFRNLTGRIWQPVSDDPKYGLLPLFLGTFKITIIAMLFAAPVAILAALFTSNFASKRMKEIIKPAVELLAGFPSVVVGFFALMVLASFFQNVFGYETRLNAFVGGIAMALAAIPIIYTITEDALTAIPKTYTEASLALGASSWQTAFFVTLPAATPGIFAAILLGTGRVFGETMIVLMATGNAAMISLNPFDSVRTLSATIGAEMAEVVFGDTHYNVLFLIGSLLFIFTFTLNAIAEFYVKGKLVKRIQGKS